MKKSLFKAALLLSAGALVFFVLYSCTKQTTTPELKTTNLSKTAVSLPGDNPFNATVGAPINGELALRWVENYNKAHGTDKNTFYTMNSKDIKAILSDASAVGISFYYATDGTKMYVLPIGINKNGEWITTTDIPTENGRIDLETAKLWIANDKGPIDGNFFGRETFDRLFSQPCDFVCGTLALNDEGKQQLLLTRKQDGEVYSLDPVQTVWDASWIIGTDGK